MAINRFFNNANNTVGSFENDEIKETLTQLFPKYDGEVVVDITEKNNQFTITLQNSDEEDGMSYHAWRYFLQKMKLQDNTIRLQLLSEGEGFKLVKNCASGTEIEDYIQLCKSVLMSIPNLNPAEEDPTPISFHQ